MNQVSTMKAPRPRRSRQEVVGVVPPLADWPHPPLESLESCALALFRKNKMAVELYVNGRSSQEINKKTGLSGSRMWKLTRRCLRTNPRTGNIVGFWACVPGRPVEKRDKKARKPGTENRPGRKNALRHLFTEHKFIKDEMLKFLRTRQPLDGGPVPIHTYKKVVDFFHTLCRMVGLEERNEWPFCMNRGGRNAIWEWWLKERAKHALRATHNEQGEAAAANAAVDCATAGDEHEPEPLLPAFSRVELDEQLLHAIGSVGFPDRNGTITFVECRRVWALALREYRCGPILATHVTYRDKYDTNDVLILIRKAMFAPKRRTLTFPQGHLQYLPSAAYPAELEPYRGLTWMSLAFDADSCHLSIAEQQLLTKVVGCSESERVGQPTARNSIEGFHRFSASAFETLSSGTGSNPQSPARRDPEGAAQKWNIYAHHLEELLDVYSRNFNARVSQTTGKSPLQLLDELSVLQDVFISRVGDFGPDNGYRLLPSYRAKLTLSRGSKGGALQVWLAGARYSSRKLASNPLLLTETNWEVTVYVEHDGRFAHVVPDAYPDMRFGVRVMGRQLRRFPHPLEWRRLVAAANKNKGLQDAAVSGDDMLNYLIDLGQRAKAGEEGAPTLLTMFTGFMANVQANAVPFVMTQGERDELELPNIDALFPDNDLLAQPASASADDALPPSYPAALPPSPAPERAAGTPPPPLAQTPSAAPPEPPHGDDDDHFGILI